MKSVQRILPKPLLLLMIVAAAMASCSKPEIQSGSGEKNFSLTGFTKIYAGETFDIHIQQGTAYSIKATGRNTDLGDIAMTVHQGSLLDIRFARRIEKRADVRIDITMPELADINITAAAHVKTDGFGSQVTPLKIGVGGAAGCTITGAPQFIQFGIYSAGKLTLQGALLELTGQAVGSAHLQAYEAGARKVDIETDGAAKAYVMPAEQLKAIASGASHIHYKGSPQVVHAREEGAGKIIREN